MKSGRAELWRDGTHAHSPALGDARFIEQSSGLVWVPTPVEQDDDYSLLKVASICLNIIIATVASMLGTPACADVFFSQNPGGFGILISGIITRETAFEVLRALGAVSPTNWKDIAFVLDSAGGSPSAAYEIAQTIHDTSSYAAVPAGSVCGSACFMILAAAKRKVMAPDALIAVHSAETVGRGEDWDALATTAGMGKILAQYGIPAAIIGRMVATPNREVARLSLAEMQSLPGAEIRQLPAFSILTASAAVVDKYLARETAGELVAAHMKLAGDRCAFTTPRFQAGCLEGLRRALSAGAQR